MALLGCMAVQLHSVFHVDLDTLTFLVTLAQCILREWISLRRSELVKLVRPLETHLETMAANTVMVSKGSLCLGVALVRVLQHAAQPLRI
eukprot:CAMPEP_0184201170 /NCGR_PEP_ID=MMETSP0976-20121227/7902_1 /TAXON_ID=483370 /ORGANISM="non described non described, Strain CCMP2097" /LENGTH=89 /DNA_ID=CAMNT_0026505687 /DNA_START=104 /DNA_END=373 /DNA_ORIENTATION=+